MSDATSGSIRQYAKHRGCSHEAVRKAISTGRVRVSVTRTNGKTVIDFRGADAEWLANSSRVPPQTAPEWPTPPLAGLDTLSVLVDSKVGHVLLAWNPVDADADDAWKLFAVEPGAARLLSERLRQAAVQLETREH